jgi:DNA repair exonuclease SbcCD nuclease subunit
MVNVEPIRFQYFSDIHLEFYNDNIAKINRLFVKKLEDCHNKPNILLLAGDIGKPSNKSYHSFLNSISPLYDKIFITTGNHEYYKMIYHTTFELDERCRDICRSLPHDNVIFLQNETYNITDTLSIFSGTFWSHIPTSKHNDIMSSINDYRLIPNFSPSLSSLLHDESVSILNNNIINNEDMKWIVMSHHLPSFHLIDNKYRSYNTDMNYAFASNISISNHPNILAWVYGHTHSPNKEGKYYCNPIGYPNENKNWTLFKEFSILT